MVESKNTPSKKSFAQSMDEAFTLEYFTGKFISEGFSKAEAEVKAEAETNLLYPE